MLGLVSIVITGGIFYFYQQVKSEKFIELTTPVGTSTHKVSSVIGTSSAAVQTLIIPTLEKINEINVGDVFGEFTVRDKKADFYPDGTVAYLAIKFTGKVVATGTVQLTYLGSILFSPIGNEALFPKMGGDYPSSSFCLSDPGELIKPNYVETGQIINEKSTEITIEVEDFSVTIAGKEGCGAVAKVLRVIGGMPTIEKVYQ